MNRMRGAREWDVPDEIRGTHRTLGNNALHRVTTVDQTDAMAIEPRDQEVFQVVLLQRGDGFVDLREALVSYCQVSGPE